MFVASIDPDNFFSVATSSITRHSVPPFVDLSISWDEATARHWQTTQLINSRPLISLQQNKDN